MSCKNGQAVKSDQQTPLTARRCLIWELAAAVCPFIQYCFLPVWNLSVPFDTKRCFNAQIGQKEKICFALLRLLVYLFGTACFSVFHEINLVNLVDHCMSGKKLKSAAVKCPWLLFSLDLGSRNSLWLVGDALLHLAKDKAVVLFSFCLLVNNLSL